MILVTGATGFIGGHLVRRLQGAGRPFRCLVRDPARAAAAGLPEAACVRGDLLDVRSLAAAVDGVKSVVHLAGVVRARRQVDFIRGNHTATANLIDALLQRGIGAGTTRFVHVSSLAAVGPSEDGARTDRPPFQCDPVSSYGFSKRGAEIELPAGGRRVQWIALRPPIVFGPGDRDCLALFRGARRGILPAAGPDRRYSLLYVDDLVDAILVALDGTAAGCFVPLSGGVLTTEELARALGEACGRTAAPLRVPVLLVRLAGWLASLAMLVTRKPTTFSSDKVREMLAGSWVADGAKAGQVLGFKPKAELRAALRTTADWYRQQGWL